MTVTMEYYLGLQPPLSITAMIYKCHVVGQILFTVRRYAVHQGRRQPPTKETIRVGHAHRGNSNPGLKTFRQ